MQCIEACAEEAQKLDMKAWLYDENGWPSGFAGGKLLEDEKNRDKYILAAEGSYDPEASVSYLLTDDELVRVFGLEQKGVYLNLYIHTSVSTADILNPDVVKQFLELTHEALTDKFFEAYFGPAAPEMREIFDQLRLLTSYNKEHKEMGGNATIYLSLTDETYWPKDVLQQWLELYDRAEEKIAPLKETNSALYESYLERVMKEKLSTLYLFVECYSYNTSAELIDSYKAEFKEWADKFSIAHVHESTDISNLYDKWGLN